MNTALPHAHIDADGLLEYSVVYTDRALNHMSAKFRHAFTDLSAALKQVYGADHFAAVSGSGTSGMEAVARQLARGKKCLIVRNGFFSYRWTQILEQGALAAETRVLTAAPVDTRPNQAYAPAPIDTVCAEIAAFRPDIVLAPHVETASGIILPEDYIARLAEAVHAVGGLLVIDCIASGCIWLDMDKLGIDILISAPQKGWSGSPCCGLVLLNKQAYQAVQASQSDSFSLDLKKWLSITEAFENGGHAYHATQPTDALYQLYLAVGEARAIGFETLRQRQWDLGRKVRALLAKHGFASVAAQGFEAPGVVVCHTDRPDFKNGSAFAACGLQIAAGVPLQCGEPADFQTFRIGLFGLDKLNDTDAATGHLENALQKLL